MPDTEGMASSSGQKEAPKPLDGIARPGATPPPPRDQKKLLLLLLSGAGIFLLLYLFFAFILMATLPSADGGKQGLKLLGNVFYGGTSVLLLLGTVFLFLQLLKRKMPFVKLQNIFLRVSIVLLIVFGISGMTLLMINRKTPLPIDVLEPENLQALTAPVTVTFGTDTLRSILQNQSLFPKKFSWDFNGDGKIDAEKQDQTVTTVYRKKGTFSVTLRILLSDGSTRTTSRRISVPNGLFSLHPAEPLLNQEAEFGVTDLVSDPKAIDRILWDFNGDGTDDLETQDLVVKHAFAEVGVYQAKVLIQNKSGLQETYIRPITILAEREQPFDVDIVAEGVLKGSAPLGVVFQAQVQDGVKVREVRWTFSQKESRDEGEESVGERVNHIFTVPGDYEATLEVADTTGRVAEKKEAVTVLAPLVLQDLVLSGLPRPDRGKVEGTAPLEVRLAPATNIPFITFKWEQEDASRVFSSDKEYHALYETPGTYPVLLIARDAEGRTQKVPLEVNVLPPQSRVTFTATPPTGIAPLTVIFDASQSFIPEGRITGFSWTFGDLERDEKPQLLGAQVSHRFEKEGTYTVIVRALTEEGQSFEARKTIVVRSAILDACAFPSRTIGDAPMGVRFDASCSTGKITKYLWDFGDGATSEQTTATQDHVFSAPGQFSVNLEVSDEQGNLSTTTLSITVR